MYKSEYIVIYCFDQTGAHIFLLVDETDIEKCRTVMNNMIEKFGGPPKFVLFTLDDFLYKKTGIENMSEWVDIILEDFEDVNIQEINIYDKSQEQLLNKILNELFDTSFFPNEWELKFLKDQGFHVLKHSEYSE
jgi:hypothetical protein